MTPQQKNLALLSGAFAVAGALGLYAYYGVMKPDEQEAAQQESAAQLIPVRAPTEQPMDDGGLQPDAKFTRLSITRPTTLADGGTGAMVTTTVEQQGGQWRMTAPLQTGADQSTIDAVVRTLSSAKTTGVVEEKPTDEDLKKYGLLPPRWVVSARAEVPGGRGAPEQKDFTLQGGIENSFDGSVYLRRDADPRVYQAQGSIRLVLDRDTLALRTKEFLGFKPADVRGVEVRAGKNVYALARNPDGSWQRSQPRPMAADTAAIDQWLGLLANEHALAYPEDTPEQRHADGLDAPAQMLVLQLAHGEPVHLALAKQAVDGVDHAFALRTQGPQTQLVELAPNALSHLDRTEDELRDKSVLFFKREDVVKVSVEAPGAPPITVVKEQPAAADGGLAEERWTVTGGESPGPAKTWKVSSLLWALWALKAGGFGPESPKDWGKYGLDAKATTVTATNREGQVVARLQVGKEVPGKAGLLYVRGKRDQVLEVDASRLADLPKSALDLRDLPAADAGTRPELSGAPAK